MRHRAVGIATALVFLLSLSVAAPSPAVFTVTYLSAEYVYIDGGSEHGLQVGSHLAIAGVGATPVVEVVYVSGHSSSCRLLPGAPTLAVGTKLRALASDVPGDSLAASAPAFPDVSPSKDVVPTTPADIGPAPPRFSGTVSLGYYHFADASPADLNFAQANARLHLRAEHLWNEHITLVVRTRGRYDSRQRSSSDLDRNDWENRLWELSLSYDDPDAPFAVSAGRILPRRLSTGGYLDGALVEWRTASSFRVGLLGGQQPDWLYRTEGPSITRFGGYLAFDKRRSGTSRLQQTLGIIGEFHSGTTNRTFVVTQGSFYSGRWGIDHSAEFDINTGWREERAGESVSFSRAYVHTYWQFLRDLRVSLSYDNLRRYWTYEYRTLADSLFDDRARQGVRARIDWSASSSWRLSLGGGLRDQPDDADPTLSYSVSIRRSRLFRPNLAASAYLSGFDGDRENGLNYAVQLDALLDRLGMTHVRFSRYQYAVQTVDSNRSSWSLETGLDADIARRYYLSGLVQYNSGDDIDGWRLQSELGYRF